MPGGEHVCSVPRSTAQQGQALSPPSSTQRCPAPAPHRAALRGRHSLTAHRGGPFPAPLEANNQQSPKTYRHQYRWWPHEVLPATLQPRVSDRTQRSVQPPKGARSSRAPPSHPTPPHLIQAPPSHPIPAHRNLRYTGTAEPPSPIPCGGTAAAPHRPCGHAVLPRSGDLPQERGEISSEILISLFFFSSSCPTRRGTERCSNAPRTASAAPGRRRRGPRREDSRTHRLCRYRPAISQRGRTSARGPARLRAAGLQRDISGARRTEMQNGRGGRGKTRPRTAPHRRRGRGDRRGPAPTEGRTRR